MRDANITDYCSDSDAMNYTETALEFLRCQKRRYWGENEVPNRWRGIQAKGKLTLEAGRMNSAGGELETPTEVRAMDARSTVYGKRGRGEMRCHIVSELAR